MATTFTGNEFAPTLELEVSFIRPAKPGTLIGAGRVVRRGSAVAFLEGELRNATNDLIATATATTRLIRVKPGGFQL